MREKWARRIALLTGLLVLLLAMAFATIQNPIEPDDVIESREQTLPTDLQESIALDPEHIKAGRQVYKQQNCARCHSIAGKGNVYNSLDGVGTRRTAEELRNWTTGADVLEGKLPDRVFKFKQTYRELPSEDLDTLVIYMQSLRR